MHLFSLLLIAIAPPVAFLAYVLSSDRYEREPLRMVFFTLALGCASTLPATFAEGLLSLLPVMQGEGIQGAARLSFFAISPVEEACKLAVVLLFVWGNANFNEENDGIVYVTASAIGFALFENVLYVFSNGFMTGVARALTSIPLHTFCGVVMGFCVGYARFARDRQTSAALVCAGFLFAWFSHGLYDTFALSGASISLLIIPLVAILFLVGSVLLACGKRRSEARWAIAERDAGERI